MGAIKMFPRHEMLDLVVIDGKARGIVARDLETGAVESYVADAVILATGGYGNVFYLATYAKGCNATAIWRAYKKGAAFANPCYTQIHPTCIPVTGDYQSKLTLMSESLRNDGRIWVPKKKGDTRPPGQIPEDRPRLLSGTEVPELRQPLAPRHLLARRQGGLRRGPRRGQDRAGRLSRLRRGDQPPRRGYDPRALRQPFRHVRADHRRGPLQGADANLPRHPLRDGRTLGRLQPDEHDPRPLRPGRGELLRPRRQPPRGQRADAGTGRRLLHHPLHHRQLLRLEQVRQDPAPTTRRSRTPRRWVADRIEETAEHQGQANRRRLPPRARQDHVGLLRHGPQRAGAARRRWRRSPPSARSSGRTSASSATATR